MTAASLPSTLVKCLYLFFDLPDVKNGHKLDPGCEFSPLERRILLQKIFVQVCTGPSRQILAAFRNLLHTNEFST